jgi:DNA-binding PadR family transcriptional regulator
MRRADIPPGTLDLLILRTLEKGSERHGFEVARSIEQFSNDVLRVEEGSLGAVLRVLEV